MGKEEKAIGLGDGVSASVSTETTGGRTETGKWLPGVSGNPRGRPSKAEELAILDSIRTTFTPEEVKSHLREAMQLAIDNKSTRGVVAVLEYWHDRTLGKPVQRIVQESSGIVGIMAELGINIED